MALLTTWTLEQDCSNSNPTSSLVSYGALGNSLKPFVSQLPANGLKYQLPFKFVMSLLS